MPFSTNCLSIIPCSRRFCGVDGKDGGFELEAEENFSSLSTDEAVADESKLSNCHSGS